MKKILFENGKTIDGASTFNKMQDNVENVFNGKESMGSIMVENVVSKNIYKPELKSNWVKSNCSVSLSYDEYTFISTGTDMYLGNVTAKDSTYNEDRGKLIEVIGGKTLTIVPTNEQFNAIFVTSYDSNKKSLGYSRLASSSYQIPSNAKYIVIRFGVNPSNSGTTYKTKLLISYDKDTTYSSYFNLQELQENNNTINYSTNEQVIGTWVDGKPLYRKTYQISSISSSNADLVDIRSLNIETVVKLYGTLNSQANTGVYTYPMPLYDSSSNYSVLFKSDYYIRGRASIGSGSFHSCYITIEYTKTTD